MKPISLADARLAPVPDVIVLLEGMLAQAKLGDLRGVAVAAALTRGEEATAYAIGDGSVASLTLAMERLKLRLLTEP